MSHLGTHIPLLLSMSCSASSSIKLVVINSFAAAAAALPVHATPAPDFGLVCFVRSPSIHHLFISH